MTPISFVMMIAMFGSMLTAVYMNPIIALIVFAVTASLMSVCMVWEV